MGENYSQVVKTTQEYYNSDDADTFYSTIWGGEDIHIGIYDITPSILEASRLAVKKMASLLKNIDSHAKILDIGAGYGGSARFLAQKYGCHVTCLNLSEVQNQRNRNMNNEKKLDHLIEVVDGTFEAIPCSDKEFDIVWSQDAILHSGQRVTVLEEVKRVLKPEGEFIFTDPMQADNCPEGVLQPVLDRIHLETMGSFAFYKNTLLKLGFEEMDVIDLSQNLPKHYDTVRQELVNAHEKVSQVCSQEYIEKMKKGLEHWVEAGRKGYLSWGIIHFRKK